MHDLVMQKMRGIHGKEDNMIDELEIILQSLKQRNSSYYAEIACLHAKIEECTTIGDMVARLKNKLEKAQSVEK